MNIRERLFGVAMFALLAIGVQLPAKAQVSQPQLSEQQGRAADLILTEAPMAPAQAQLQAQPAQNMSESEAELAQARRRGSGRVRSSDFIGVGADIGYADDVSLSVISKFSLNDRIALRPSVLIGDDFSILVPVTYDFTQANTELGDFQIRPYAGVGAAYTDNDDDDDFNLLLAAGADVPLSRQFTLNAQANLGVLNDTNFGVTVGVGYNFR
ncbi:MAG: outer membrane beta-barrel protein [Cyanobacteria bacterium J06623_4]